MTRASLSRLLCALLLFVGGPAASFAQTVSVSAESAAAARAPAAVGAVLSLGSLGFSSAPGALLPTSGLAPVRLDHGVAAPVLLPVGAPNLSLPPAAVRSGVAQGRSRHAPVAPLAAAKGALRASPAGAVSQSVLLKDLGGRIETALGAERGAPEASGRVAAELGRHWDGSPILNGDVQAESVPQAAPLPAGGGVQRSLDSIRRLKVGTYNVLNLFEKVGKHIPDPDRPGRLKKVSDREQKAEWQLRESARAILESDLDIVTLEEVETIAALDDFNSRFLEGRYRTFLIEGNDERGIDVAFLVKKDLPFEVEHRSHKDETWVDPLLGGPPRTLFSRDLPVLIVRAPGRAEPLFVLFGTHYKSKRTRLPGDPESADMRKAQVERTAEIIGRYREEFGPATPIMLAGDFNGQMNEEEEFASLKGKAGLIDSFDALPHPPSAEERITHTYHPRDGARQAHQMDAVMVSEAMRKLVASAVVYRYRDAQGKVKPLPRTFDDRNRNPSDHFPVVVTLEFPPLLARVLPPAIEPK